MSKSFIPGDSVKIKSLRKNGTVDTLIGANKARVTVGSLNINCKFDDLELLPSKKSTPASREYRAIQQFSHLTTKGAPDTIDLHGMRVNDAIKALESAIDNAILGNLDCLKVVHGFGTGKVKDALDSYLKTLSVVKAFKLDPNNTGVTVVYF